MAYFSSSVNRPRSQIRSWSASPIPPILTQGTRLNRSLPSIILKQSISLDSEIKSSLYMIALIKPGAVHFINECKCKYTCPDYKPLRKYPYPKVMINFRRRAKPPYEKS